MDLLGTCVSQAGRGPGDSPRTVMRVLFHYSTYPERPVSLSAKLSTSIGFEIQDELRNSTTVVNWLAVPPARQRIESQLIED